MVKENNKLLSTTTKCKSILIAAISHFNCLEQTEWEKAFNWINSTVSNGILYYHDISISLKCWIKSKSDSVLCITRDISLIITKYKLKNVVVSIPRLELMHKIELDCNTSTHGRGV